jgi:triosephosphate isomerase
MTRRKLIAGNWKMNGLKADALALVDQLLQKRGSGAFAADLLVCPPAVFLDAVGQKLAGSMILMGGQDCHPQQKGAHTGDISAAMIKDMGGSHVIVGHSERRAHHRESNALIKSKAEAALLAGLVPILCIGETEEERASGKALEVVAQQLAHSLPDGANADALILAYEPVWAIGTGRTPTLPEVQEVHADLRRELGNLMGSGAKEVQILYGGSVTPANAGALLTLPDVDGGLVGGASLNADMFWDIALASLGGHA